MASDTRRVNLSLDPDFHDEINEWRKENGVSSMAAACTMLIRQALTSNQQMKQMYDLIKHMPMDKLMEISQEGFDFMKKTSPDSE